MAEPTRAPRGIYPKLMPYLEELRIYEGVSNAAIADVFQLNRRTVAARLNEVGAGEVKRLRDVDVAFDKKVELIINGILPPAAAANLPLDRQQRLLDLGIIKHIYPNPPEL